MANVRFFFEKRVNIPLCVHTLHTEAKQRVTDFLLRHFNLGESSSRISEFVLNPTMENSWIFRKTERN